MFTNTFLEIIHCLPALPASNSPPPYVCIAVATLANLPPALLARNTEPKEELWANKRKPFFLIGRKTRSKERRMRSKELKRRGVEATKQIRRIIETGHLRRKFAGTKQRAGKNLRRRTLKGKQVAMDSGTVPRWTEQVTVICDGNDALQKGQKEIDRSEITMPLPYIPMPPPYITSSES